MKTSLGEKSQRRKSCSEPQGQQKKRKRPDASKVRRSFETEEERSAYERRREQVRNAQRNHRQRKILCVEMMRQNVCRLCEEAASLKQDLAEIEAENFCLKEQLIQNGLPVLTTSGRPPKKGRLQLRSDRDNQDYRPSPSPSSNFRAGHEDYFGSVSSDFAESGIRFVLSLERTCLGFDQMDQYYEDSASSPASHSPAPSSIDSFSSISSPGDGAPVELERLLQLSSSLDLVGEITPIQAWARLSVHPQFQQLCPTRLYGLRLAMARYMRYQSFGAVIDEDIYESILREHLGDAKRDPEDVSVKLESGRSPIALDSLEIT